MTAPLPGKAKRQARARSTAPSWFYPLMRPAALVLAAAIAYLSLTADPTAATGGFDPGAVLSALLFGTDAYGDKASHVIAYTVLGGAFGLAFARRAKQALATGAALFGYSAALEILQGLGGQRAMEGLDLLANAVGIGLGLFAAILVRLFFRRRKGRLS